MTIGYYSDEFCEDLRKFSKLNPNVAPAFRKLQKRIQSNGIHFQLPHGGYVLPAAEDEVYIDTDILRPPYPVTVLEYPEGGGELRSDEEPSTKRLVVAVDEADSVVLFPAYYSDNRDMWTPPVLYWRFKYGHRFSLSRTKPKDLQDESGLTYGECWPGLVRQLGAAMTLEEYAAMDIRNINQELSVYMDMCMALAEYETEFTEHRPDANQAKLRRLRSKPPLLTYKVITITGKKKAASEAKGGTHASPVAHLRRGHWRHYKSGKRAWIEPMMVNGKDGMVVKDYKVEGRV